MLQLYPELEVLHEGTQEGNGQYQGSTCSLNARADFPDNYTRFILLSRGIEDRADAGPGPASVFYAIASADAAHRLISTSERFVAIHARPAHTGVVSGRYPLSYVVELEPKDGKLEIVSGEEVAYLGSSHY